MQYPGCLAIFPFIMFWFGRGHGLQNILVSLLKCRSLGPRPDLHWIRTATVPRNLSFQPAFPGDSHPGHSLRTTIGTFVLVDWSVLKAYQELCSDSLLMVKSVYFTKIKWIISNFSPQWDVCSHFQVPSLSTKRNPILKNNLPFIRAKLSLL